MLQTPTAEIIELLRSKKREDAFRAFALLFGDEVRISQNELCVWDEGGDASVAAWKVICSNTIGKRYMSYICNRWADIIFPTESIVKIDTLHFVSTLDYTPLKRYMLDDEWVGKTYPRLRNGLPWHLFFDNGVCLNLMNRETRAVTKSDEVAPRLSYKARVLEVVNSLLVEETKKDFVPLAPLEDYMHTVLGSLLTPNLHSKLPKTLIVYGFMTKYIPHNELTLKRTKTIFYNNAETFIAEEGKVTFLVVEHVELRKRELQRLAEKFGAEAFMFQKMLERIVGENYSTPEAVVLGWLAVGALKWASMQRDTEATQS